MTGAFCPGHITCFFHPVRTGDPVTTGSRGAGLRLSSGTRVTLEERSDGVLSIVMDGAEADACVTKNVMNQICPGRGFDVIIENDLPVGQGFGMSASGAIAAALAACGLTGIPEENAYRFAHIAEVTEGGGLGDVAAIQSNVHHPVRIRPGLPPYGEVRSAGLRFDRLTLAVIGTKLRTAPVITDPGMQKRMTQIAEGLIDDYYRDSSEEALFRMSRQFSSSLSIESADVRSALDRISEIAPAGMCMLGHSIFTTLSEDEVKEILGEDVPVFVTSTSDRPAFIRKA